ncbi:Rieske (2Fe-2S) protein [Derxia lacustris]|uniref:Rieske (2Fe-2S) protein n=1 Tax=Derxia lacustris TaxID=764842 RepID=UPI000A17431C|nr:Rieske 2Fe-2S domain-containing protein [Derxia lacustris]
MTPPRRCLGAFADLPDGDSRGFDPAASGQDSLFIVRRGERVFAWRDACPHIDGARMAWRRHAYLNAARSRIVCHAHGAEFDIETGRCLRGPCVGSQLLAVEVTVEADGGLWLHGPVE